MKILKRPAKIKATFKKINRSGSHYEQYLELLKLYPIVPATAADRSWWKNMKARYFVNRQITKDGISKQQGMSTMKYCPGIFDFSNCGYIVPCLHDIKFYISKDKKVSWQIPKWLPQEWIEAHDKREVDSCPINHGKITAGVIIKVITPWFWETPKGWSTIITKPFYNYSNDFDVCPGIIDSDLDNSSNHTINVFLRFNVVDKEIIFRAGQPLCQLIPFERQNTKLTITDVPSKKAQKMMQRDMAKSMSKFPDNPERTGPALMNYRDTSTKKYE
jgi:hypothetical protein